jgi:hypothetical protein
MDSNSWFKKVGDVWISVPRSQVFTLSKYQFPFMEEIDLEVMLALYEKNGKILDVQGQYFKFAHIKES